LAVDGTRSVGLRSGSPVSRFRPRFCPVFSCLHRSGRVGRCRYTFHVLAPVNRFRVSVHVFAQFLAVCTVPDALAVDGTRSTFYPRLTVFAFPSTFSPSFQLFSPSFQLFAPFRTRWPLTGHVPSDFVPVHRFRVSVHVFAQFSAVLTVADVLGVYATCSAGFTVFAFPFTFSATVPTFSAVFTVPDVLPVNGTRSVGLPSGSPFSRFRPRFRPPYPRFQQFSPFRR
jgi:hypothetical protein